MIKHPRLLLLLMMLVPWLTLPFLGKSSIKRYFSATLFMALFIRIESYLAKKRKWWWFYEKVYSKARGETPLIWGPFFVGSLWILKLTYGRFFTYLLVNLAVDTWFTYPFVNWLTKSGIASLVRFKKIHLSALLFVKSLLLYGFQFFTEKVKKVK